MFTVSISYTYKANSILSRGLDGLFFPRKPIGAFKLQENNVKQLGDRPCNFPPE